MNLKEIILKCDGSILNPEVSLPETFHQIKTDTREIKEGDIFVALKGQRYDGHQYIDEAIAKGAIAVFVERKVQNDKIPMIKVNSTYQCLFDAARFYLETYPVFVIAVTGSVGKTTTKELIAGIVSKKYRTLKSLGNKNNRIGIPQTIFKLNKDIECLIVELGMNHAHEIEKLSDLVKPNISVITNIGSAHIGNLGSKKNILKAKLEILSGMDGGILILNQNDKLLKNIKKITKGSVEQVTWKKGNIQIKLLEQTVFGSKLSIDNGIEKKVITFSNPGLSILDDIALALKVGELLEIPFIDMVNALKEYNDSKSRFLVELLENGNILVNDCYNSSYESLKMDLELLQKCEQKKILILGDILELGKSSKKIHQKIGKELKKMTNCTTYFIGQDMKYAWKKYKQAKYFRTKEEFISEWLSCGLSTNQIIFLKASRKMNLESLIPYIK